MDIVIAMRYIEIYEIKHVSGRIMESGFSMVCWSAGSEMFKCMRVFEFSEAHNLYTY